MLASTWGWVKCISGIHSYRHVYEHVVVCDRCGFTTRTKKIT
jgi:hypothetical protein